MAGYVYHFLFQVSYAWNRLEEAADWLHHLQRIAQDWHLMDLLVRGEMLAARLGLAKGNLSVVEQSLQQLQAMIEQEGLANHAPGMISLRVQWWLAQANLAEAVKWAAQSTLSPEAWNPLRKGEVLMLVRVSLAQKQYVRAEETLSRFGQYFDQPGDLLTALEWMALSVVALCHGDKRAQARTVAARLLALTEPEGYIRVYLDAGPLMKSALKMLLEAPPDDPSAEAVAISGPYVSRLLAAFGQEEQKRASVREVPSAIRHNNLLHHTPIEPLSPQEQRVLRLLVAGQTYAEMAEALVVSPNTIKTQISSIYRKLGVSRRAEAIAVTAHMHLL
jgi:LuxR family maltose regulon positive regulatory protein